MKGKKKCPVCKLVKDRVKDFYFVKSRGAAGCAMSLCIPCSRTRVAEWRKIESSKKTMRNARHAHYKRKRKEKDVRFNLTSKLNSSKINAKRRGHLPCELTLDQLEKVYSSTCGCCGVDAGLSICLDHCHETGRFRGWLCHSCNRFIGLAKESVSVLKKAVAYLEAGEKVTCERHVESWAVGEVIK